jgi:hypothetical protein
MAAANIDHDQNFKNLISTFFIEFLELFLPELAQKIDPKSIKFLKQQYFTDLIEGEDSMFKFSIREYSSHDGIRVSALD